jgi:hypothetical protein
MKQGRVTNQQPAQRCFRACNVLKVSQLLYKLPRYLRNGASKMKCRKCLIKDMLDRWAEVYIYNTKEKPQDPAHHSAFSSLIRNWIVRVPVNCMAIIADHWSAPWRFEAGYTVPEGRLRRRYEMEKLVVWRGISVATVELAVKPHTQKSFWKQSTRRRASEPPKDF